MRNTGRNIELTRPPAILIALNATTTTTAGTLVQIYIMDIIDTADSSTSAPASRYGRMAIGDEFFIFLLLLFY